MASDLDPKSQVNAPSESRSGHRQIEVEGLCHHDHEHEGHRFRHHDIANNEENISIPSHSKLAEQAIAPFLAQHIPTQYNPVGHLMPPSNSDDPNHDHHQDTSSTKFCYRHRPDFKCRRQANEPSMEQLQNELGTLSQSDQQAISHVWSLFSAAPSKHRNLMLQGILSQCCFPQLSYISASVRDLIKIDFLSALPPELGFKILCFLDTTSLCKAAQVSRRWRSLADDDVVWHRMCEQHIDRKCTKCGWGLPLLERKRLRIEKRQIQLRAISRGNNECSPTITPLVQELGAVTNNEIAQTGLPLAVTGEKRKFDVEPALPQKRVCTQALGEETGDSNIQPQTRRPWKDVYKDRFKVGTNWKYGRCSTKIFRGHTNGVMCLQFDENVLITGSYDCTAKVWDIKTGKELRTLEGHTSGIRTLQFDDQKLITGSMDNTTKVWDWRTGECLRTFRAHTGGVICVNFDACYIASGSMDHTIRVFDGRSKATFLLKGHTDWVNAVKLDSASRTLISASDDCTVRLWDLDTRRCIKVFEGHVGQVQQVVALPPEFELDEADLLSGDNEDDNSSTSSGPSPVPKHSHHPISTWADLVAPFWPDEPDRAAPPRYMLTSALDSTIRLWDVHAPAVAAAVGAGVQKPPTTNACLRTYFGHVEGIWALASDHLRMVSGSEDRTVKIWDPRSGKCERTWTGHAGPITCIGLSDSRLVSGSEDCEVRMLLFNTGEGSEES